MSDPTSSDPEEIIVPATEQEYTQTMAGLELVEIALVGVQAQLLDRRALTLDTANLTTAFNLNADFKTFDMEGDRIVVVLQHIQVLMTNSEQTPALSILCSFQVDYKSREEFSKGFFAIFRQATLLLQVLPYARELVQSITSRMNVPVVTLPIFRIPTSEALSTDVE